MGDYYGAVWERAWNATVHFGRSQLPLNVILVLLPFFIGVFLNPPKDLWDTMRPISHSLAAFLVLLLGVLAWNLASAPVVLHEEQAFQLSEVAGLKAQLWERETALAREAERMQALFSRVPPPKYTPQQLAAMANAFRAASPWEVTIRYLESPTSHTGVLLQALQQAFHTAQWFVHLYPGLAPGHGRTVGTTMLVPPGPLQPHQQAVRNGFAAADIPIFSTAGPVVVGDRVEIWIGQI